MYWWVAASLRQHILDHYKIDATGLDSELEMTVNELISDYHREASQKKSEISGLVEQLVESEALAPELLIRVLRVGEISLFEAMFAKLTTLNDTALRRVLYQPPGYGLAIACKALGIDKADFASIFLLSRQGRPGDQEVDPGELNLIVAFFDGLVTSESADQLKRWRLNPEHLAAIQDLKEELDRKQ